MDLRSYWASCSHRLEVHKTTHCAHEIPAVLTALEAARNHDAVLFQRVTNNHGGPSTFRVMSNLFARPDAIEAMLAQGGIRDHDAFNARIASDGELHLVDDAPVKQHIYSGDAIDLRELPVVTHHELDAGPYFTAGVVVVKDPETGTYNAALQRLLIQDKNSLGIFMVPTGQNKTIHRKYLAAGRDMPVAVVVGHHPLFYFGAQTKEPIERDEYKIAAALMPRGLRLTPCPSFPELLVPADAELVIEGYIPSHETRPEGPFGEYSHYYCAPADREYIRVTAIMHRRDPLYLDIFACHRDHHLLEGTLMSAQLTQYLRARYPGFVRLSLPLSGCCQLYCYVALAKQADVDLQQVGREILSAQEYIKYVVFVDDDIDVTDEAEVLWAIATRATLSTDMQLTRASGGTRMDPTARGDDPERGVIDATAKDPQQLRARVRVHPSVSQQLRLEDYLQAP